jgi:hypothetical protein
MSSLTHLERRAIQAPVVACLIRAFITEHGAAYALATATAAIQQDAEAGGHAACESLGGNGLRELAQVVRDTWAQGGALEVMFLTESDQELSFDVVRCRYVELYENLGMKDLGPCLSCSRDEAFVRGFNPAIAFVREGTIMEGADHCDFHFSLTT